MTFDSVKQSVNKEIIKLKIDKEDKIILAALVINILDTYSNSKQQTSSLISSCVKTYEGIVSTIRDKYVSYKEMIKLIRYNKVSDILHLTRDIINKIVSLYEIKQRILQFDLLRYDSGMYNIMINNDEDNDRLRNTHFNIMVPIVNYYMKLYMIRESDIFVEDSDIGMIGKSIKFGVSGIDSSVILGDIATDRIGIAKYIHLDKLTIDTDGNLIIIIK